ncbi:Hypothetical predicted protein [Prunus dulcis]|uniref:Uncharacterized protein n=1 Tax=Prunus dulcis TaxID=3755 RepID=A0A5E4G6Z8_PRUDU|nr:Hypothetical predicted protein [Prunus dulcis]
MRASPLIISPSRSIRDNPTLVSSDGSFELGFFRPGISTNRYLGMETLHINALASTTHQLRIFNTFGCPTTHINAVEKSSVEPFAPDLASLHPLGSQFSQRKSSPHTKGLEARFIVSETLF